MRNDELKGINLPPKEPADIFTMHENKVLPLEFSEMKLACQTIIDDERESRGKKRQRNPHYGRDRFIEKNTGELCIYRLTEKAPLK